MLSTFPSELPAVPSSAPACAPSSVTPSEADAGGSPAGAFADFLDAVAATPSPASGEPTQPVATLTAPQVALPDMVRPAPMQSVPVLLWQFAEQLRSPAQAPSEPVVAEVSDEGETTDTADVECDESIPDSKERAAVDPQSAAVIPFPMQPVSPPPPLGLPGFAPVPPAATEGDSAKEESALPVPGLAFRFTRNAPARPAETMAPIESAPAPIAPVVTDTAPVQAAAVFTATPALKGRGAPVGESKEATGSTPSQAAATPVSQTPAQISAPTSPGFAGEGNNPGSKNKNRSQDTELKVDATVASSAGTARAYEQASMSSSSATFAPPAAVVRASEAMTAPAPAAAVRLVERVAEVSEHLAANPAEPMSLSIQLDDTHRVDVRVTMRDGQVHTAFRSDSPEVRAALSSAWEGFVRSRDGAEQRWAEPVFAPLGSSTPAAPSLLAAAPVSDARSEAGLAGSGQEQQHRQQQAPEPRPDGFAGPRSRAAAFASPASLSVQPAAVRPDSSRHLSAVA
jgi:hypothetical protein